MKRFLNTFYVLSEDIYLSLEGENVVAIRDKQEVARYPLHTLQGIVSFSYAGASPALMGACAKRGVGVRTLHAERAVPCAGIRRNKRKCTAAAHSIQNGGRYARKLQNCADDDICKAV